MGAVQSNKRKNQQVKKKTDRKDEFQKQSAPNIYESSKDSTRSGASRLFGNALQGVRKNKGHESEKKTERECYRSERKRKGEKSPPESLKKSKR